ncbi:polysaccharide deacetylase family protein [Sphingobium algorifonticola]|uniref:polysaccharide deacetylase family protein n=1 Tax=Sphingobium algorifonticola TaxID=2008318 RepID=UPI0019D0625F|nr:hypothetical protein [Sphingobium algorifonticola]
MTRVYITVDTELSASHFAHHGREGLSENFDRAILGRTATGDVGIVHQMRRLDAHGLKAVFFVDPLPGLVVGPDIVKRIVHPILDHGHDVQLHVHSEWLAFAERSPVDGRTGRNIGDFSLADQFRIIGVARDLLTDAGAPAPIAFRAGNYGANDDTLRALARLGIRYDSSFCPGIARSACRITLSADVLAPVDHCGVIEVPVGAITGWGEGRRHVQLTALSAWEMAAAIEHAVASNQASFSLVSHSFELLNRRQGTVNPIVARRFDRLCALLAGRKDITTGTYIACPPVVPPPWRHVETLPHSPVRTALRLGEQFLSNHLFGETPSPRLMPHGRLWMASQRIIHPLHHLVPLQNLAMDALTAF